MYNKVENSKTYLFQQNSLKTTQYLGFGEHFSDLGKTGLKTQKLSFCQFNSGQMKHNFKKLKEIFVKNISILNPMVLVSNDDNCTDYGVHFPKPIFEYLHTFFTKLGISVIFFEIFQDTWNFSHSCSILKAIHS